jgi:DNA-binding transcriptional regulator YiaG
MSSSNDLRMTSDFDTTQSAGRDQGPRTRALPMPPIIRFCAEFRWGLETVIVLAWLSEDERVREVAAVWSSLTAAEKLRVEIEVLCLAVGVEPADFIRAVAAIAEELKIKFSLRPECGDVRPYTQQAVEYDLLSRPTLGPIPTSVYIRDDVPRRQNKRISLAERVRSAEDHEACDAFAANRRDWRLSKTEFANLFQTTRRSVGRWEDHLYGPTPHQQWLLERFLEYVMTNGRRAFRRRFVRQTPRIGIWAGQ